MNTSVQTSSRRQNSPRLASNFLGGPALSLASQVVGLCQLMLLLWRVGANEATDAYFYLFNMGMLPIQIVIVGMVYPLLLNEEKITRRALKRVRWMTPVLSSSLICVGAAWLYMGGRLSSELFIIAGASLFNAAVQARVWFRAVTAEAEGNPRWISGVALPSNVLALITLSVPIEDPPTAVSVMVGGLVVGNLAMLIVMSKIGVGDDIVRFSPRSKPTQVTAPYWFLGKAGVGYVGLTVLQSLAVLLPPSAVTLLNLAVKVVGSISATLVNAVMPLLVHQKIDSPAAGRKFLRLLVGGLAVASTAGVLGVALLFPDLTVPAICLSLWAVASAAAATAQRMSFRFLKASASRVTILAVPIVVCAALASVQGPGYQLVVLLCAYASVDAATSTLLLVSLRDRLMSIVSGSVMTGLAIIWILTVTQLTRT